MIARLSPVAFFLLKLLWRLGLGTPLRYLSPLAEIRKNSFCFVFYKGRQGCPVSEPSQAGRGTQKHTLLICFTRGAKGAPLRNPAPLAEVRKNTLCHFFLQGAGRVPRFGTQPRWQRYAKTHFSVFLNSFAMLWQKGGAPCGRVRKWVSYEHGGHVA